MRAARPRSGCRRPACRGVGRHRRRAQIWLPQQQLARLGGRIGRGRLPYEGGSVGRGGSTQGVGRGGAESPRLLPAVATGVLRRRPPDSSNRGGSAATVLHFRTGNVVGARLLYDGANRRAVGAGNLPARPRSVTSSRRWRSFAAAHATGDEGRMSQCAPRRKVIPPVVSCTSLCVDRPPSLTRPGSCPLALHRPNLSRRGKDNRWPVGSASLPWLRSGGLSTGAEQQASGHAGGRPRRASAIPKGDDVGPLSLTMTLLWA